MNFPSLLTIRQAKVLLEDFGIELSERQMKRAAEPDPAGNRKLPFFVDPIDGKLKIEKGRLVKIYQELIVSADNNVRKK